MLIDTLKKRYLGRRFNRGNDDVVLTVVDLALKDGERPQLVVYYSLTITKERVMEKTSSLSCVYETTAFTLRNNLCRHLRTYFCSDVTMIWQNILEVYHQYIHYFAEDYRYMGEAVHQRILDNALKDIPAASLGEQTSIFPVDVFFLAYNCVEMVSKTIMVCIKDLRPSMIEVGLNVYYNSPSNDRKEAGMDQETG